MLDLFIHIVLCSLVIHGIHAATRSGMVFGFVEDYFADREWPKWGDPVSECTICMASIWGSSYFLVNVIDFLMPIHALIGAWVGFVFAVAGLNWIISEFQ